MELRGLVAGWEYGPNVGGVVEVVNRDRAALLRVGDGSLWDGNTVMLLLSAGANKPVWGCGWFGKNDWLRALYSY